MKRLLWLLAALCLMIFPALAQAEGSICSYTVAQGAEICTIHEADGLSVPQGLEGMYALMRTANSFSDVYLIRMPNGRALASVSCTTLSEPCGARELLALWPRIAEAIGREAAYVDGDAACAEVRSFNGFDALCIDTSIVVGEESMALLDARGRVFCRGNDLMEIWTVAPADPIYLFDDEAAAELESDRSDLDDFLDSLDFSEAGGEPDGADESAEAGDEWQASIDSVLYADPDGHFTVEVPLGCTILNASSAEADIAAARESYVAANPDGAGAAFDSYLADITDERATLILTEDMRFAAELFCEEAPEFQGMTPRAFLSLAEPVRQGIEEKFGGAEIAGDGALLTFAGVQHARLTYRVRADAFDLTLHVMAAMTDEVWLREVDFYIHDGESGADACEAVMELIVNTLTYIPAGDGTEV